MMRILLLLSVLTALLASPVYADDHAARTASEVLIEQAHWKGRLWQRCRDAKGDFWAWSDMYGVPLPARMRMALPEKPPPARDVARHKGWKAE